MLTTSDARAVLEKYGVEFFDPTPYNSKIQRTADEHGITIYPCRRGASRALAWRHEIYAPWPAETEADVAEVAHELAHTLQPRCTRRDPHYRDPDIFGSTACVACEAEAWAIAVALLRPLRWTRGMHARLVWGLDSYRRTTKTYPQAQREADRLVTNLSFCKIQQLALDATLPKPFSRGERK
jgi:hypothetical protein